MAFLEITVQRPVEPEVYPVVADLRDEDGLSRRAEVRWALKQPELLTLMEPRAYGLLLGQGIFAGPVRDLLLQAMAQPEGRLHLLLLVEPPELFGLRWERLCSPSSDDRWDHLGLNQRIPFSIYLPTQTERRFPAFGRASLRALVLVTSPPGLDRLGYDPFDAPAALDAVARGLGALPFDALHDGPGALGPPTLDRLCQALTETPYTLLHVVSHGAFDRRTGETAVLWPGEDGQATPVTAEDLIRRLARVEGRHGLPHLAFLSTCESADPRAEGALGGLAHRLVRELGMPAVIAMTERISQATALALGEAFYPRLAEHGSVDLALAEGLASLGDRYDATVPALYSRLRGRPLFDDSLSRPATVTELERALKGLPPHFEARAPVLTPRVTALVERVSAGLELQDRGLSDQAHQEHKDAVQGLSVLCEEALDISLQGLALGASPHPFDGRCPFPGLRAFTGDERTFYFGREALLDRLEEALERHPFLAVLGPSGSGKSSLVLAGLAKRLESAGAAARTVRMVPGAAPLRALGQALEREGWADLLDTAKRRRWMAAGGADRGHDDARGGPGAGSAGAREARAPEAADPLTRRLLVIDQFEEVFTLGAPAVERAAFFDLLLDLSQDLPTVLTLRADFWGSVAPFDALRAALEAHQVLVPPMDPRELRSAMEQQARVVGLRFEGDLAADILEDVLSEPGAMPLLQHALLQLWRRRWGRWLKLDEYRRLGGIARAIASTADEIFATLEEAERERMRSIFTRLTRMGESGPDAAAQDTRRRVTVSALIPAGEEPTPTRNLLRRLADQRLLVTDRPDDGGEETVEVAHEALIRHWPRLRRWLREDWSTLQALAAIGQAAQEWAQGGRDESLLLHRGGRLQEAEALQRTPRHSLSELEAAYVEACVDNRDREAREKEAQRQKELAQARELAEQAQALAAEQQRAAEAEKARAEEARQAATKVRMRSRLIAVLGVLALGVAAAAAALYQRAEAETVAAEKARGDAYDGLLVNATFKVPYSTEQLAMLREVTAPERSQDWLQVALRALASPWHGRVLSPAQAAEQAGLPPGDWEYVAFGSYDTYALQRSTEDSGGEGEAAIVVKGEVHPIAVGYASRVFMNEDGIRFLAQDSEGVLRFYGDGPVPDLAANGPIREAPEAVSSAWDRVATRSPDGDTLWDANGERLAFIDGSAFSDAAPCSHYGCPPTALVGPWVTTLSVAYPPFGANLIRLTGAPKAIAPCGLRDSNYIGVQQNNEWAWVVHPPEDAPGYNPGRAMGLSLCHLWTGQRADIVLEDLEAPLNEVLNYVYYGLPTLAEGAEDEGGLLLANLWSVVQVDFDPARTDEDEGTRWYRTRSFRVTSGHPGGGQNEDFHAITSLKPVRGGGFLATHRCGGLSVWTPSQGLQYANLPSADEATSWEASSQFGLNRPDPLALAAPADGRLSWNGTQWQLNGGALHREALPDLQVRSYGEGAAVVRLDGQAALAYTTRDPRVLRIHTIEGEAIDRRYDVNAPVAAPQASPDGSRLLVAVRDTNRKYEVSGALILDVSTGAVLQRLEDAGPYDIDNTGVGHRADGRKGANYVSPDRHLRVWVCEGAARPDVCIFAFSGSDTQQDVGSAAPTPVCSFAGHSGRWDSPVWSSDSAVVATGGAEILIHTTSCDGSSPLIIPTRATPVGFIPGTHDLVTVGEGGGVRIWPTDPVKLRDLLWRLTDYCIPPERRQALLFEDEGVARERHQACVGAVAKGEPPAWVLQ